LSESKYKSRKFYLTIVSMAVVTVGLFTKFLSGSEFIAGLTISLGVYASANVFEGKH
jgi:uncharacterized membrane protein YiaA